MEASGRFFFFRNASAWKKEVLRLPPERPEELEVASCTERPWEKREGVLSERLCHPENSSVPENRDDTCTGNRIDRAEEGYFPVSENGPLPESGR